MSANGRPQSRAFWRASSLRGDRVRSLTKLPLYFLGLRTALRSRFRRSVTPARPLRITVEALLCDAQTQLHRCADLGLTASI